jgi:hypothetical protein
MSWIITPTYDGLVSDPDANTYLAAVQAADGQLLEPDVRIAINNFIVGCKTDGIWNAIKASCILAGARTLAGALVPLVGTASTNYNFVSGDYNRETGLIGDGSTKYLDSNRNNNADPQNDQHLSVYVTQAGSVNPGIYIGAGSPSDSGATHFGSNISLNLIFFRNRNNTALEHSTANSGTLGSIGMSRSSSSSYIARAEGLNNSFSQSSQTSYNSNVSVFWRTGSTGYSDGRLAFYSIGESLNLALLDARVTTLMSDLAAAIP